MALGAVAALGECVVADGLDWLIPGEDREARKIAKRTPATTPRPATTNGSTRRARCAAVLCVVTSRPTTLVGAGVLHVPYA